MLVIADTGSGSIGEIVPFAQYREVQVNQVMREYTFNYGGFSEKVKIKVFGSYTLIRLSSGWAVDRRDLFVQGINSTHFVVEILSASWIDGISSITIAGQYRVTYRTGATVKVMGTFDYSAKV